MWFVVASALAGLPAHPLDPATVDAVPHEVAEALQALAAQEVRCDPDAKRKRQDAQLQRALHRLVDASHDAQEAVDALPKGPSRDLLTGRIHEQLAFALADGDAPSYLNPQQVELYTMAIEDKATAQQLLAVAAYEAAMEGYGLHVPSPLVDHVIDTWLQLDRAEDALRVASEHGRDAEAARIEAAAAERARQEVAAEEARRIAHDEALEALATGVDDLAAALDGARCAADVAEEAQLVLEQATAVLEAGDGDIALEAPGLVRRYVRVVSACPRG